MVCISFNFGCKKEDANDPNIEYAAFNTNLAYIKDDYNYKSFDVNNDGIDDISLEINSEIDGSDEELEIRTFAPLNNDLLKISYNKETFGGSLNQVAKAYSKGEVINSASSDFIDDDDVTLDALLIGEYSEGHFHGSGDKFIGFRFKPTETTSGFYFGWLRVNISTDFKTIKIIDGASHKIADTPINAGAK